MLEQTVYYKFNTVTINLEVKNGNKSMLWSKKEMATFDAKVATVNLKKKNNKKVKDVCSRAIQIFKSEEDLRCNAT